jgi:hypothetical protein
MRLALDQGIEPRRYAFGAAAALAALDPSILERARSAQVLLDPLWRAESPPRSERAAVLGGIEAGLERLRAWCDAQSGDLERVFEDESDD